MSDTSSRLSALATPVNRTLSLIKFGVLVVSVAAAVPTARNLYFAWNNNVPFNQVDHRLAQAALLEKNFDCKIDYRSLATSPSARVEVGSCKATGDISIKVTSSSGQVNYEWIAFEQLPKPVSQSASLSLMDLVVSKALAGEAGATQVMNLDAPFRVAEDTMEVMCQSKKADVVVRVVKEAGKCMQETVSIFRGAVEKRQEVACDKACPIPN